MNYLRISYADGSPRFLRISKKLGRDLFTRLSPGPGRTSGSAIKISTEAEVDSLDGTPVETLDEEPVEADEERLFCKNNKFNGNSCSTVSTSSDESEDSSEFESDSEDLREPFFGGRDSLLSEEEPAWAENNNCGN
ncbi:hypothetical protein GCK72_005465 [Caenorhabditis remanei]|uniref:Uncharacterized protein n=1 Tax=Caenorhabditis remanei TaxID=31234 RepID=A0A6A5HGM7_CAERE|nr:hypothetical protein GCK72_005465 [Caenorhabditis remanei]KAF1765513.1 hypothetical protein GCK72_005465 [Caenorhabditis remanei]